MGTIEEILICHFYFFLDESKLEKNNGMNDKLDPEMMGRTNPGMNGGMKNGNGNMHGNGHHPLPPDGMYHVSDGNGHGMNGFNGGITNGMDNGNALAAALSSSVDKTLSLSFSTNFSPDLLRPSSSRSTKRTVSPDRVLNFFRSSPNTTPNPTC